MSQFKNTVECYIEYVIGLNDTKRAVTWIYCHLLTELKHHTSVQLSGSESLKTQEENNALNDNALGK